MKHHLTFRAHDSHIPDLLFTPDSRHLISAGMDNVVHLWSAPSWEHVRTLEGHEKSVNTLSLTSSGTNLITASSDRTVKLWQINDGRQVRQYEEQGISATLSPGDRYLGISDRTSLVIKDLKTDTTLLRFKPFPKRTTAFAFSQDEEWLTIGGQGNDILIYHLPELTLAHTIQNAHEMYTLSLAFSPTGQIMTSTGLEQRLRFWDVNDWASLGEVQLENPGVQSIAWAHLGDLVGVASDHQITLVDPIEKKVTERIELKPKGVYCLDFSNDGHWLACGAADKLVRIWSL